MEPKPTHQEREVFSTFSQYSHLAHCTTHLHTQSLILYETIIVTVLLLKTSKYMNKKRVIVFATYAF